ncbi:MAG: TorF family putative porin [Planctomycetia bacterium]
MRATTASLCSILACASCAQLEPRTSASLNASGNYLGRGVLVHDGAVLQPSVDVAVDAGAGTLTTSVWANIDASDEFDAFGSTTELDLVVDWTASTGGVNASLGAIQYLFPHSGAAPTTELYASLQAAEAPLTPALTIYWDMIEADGLYATFGAGHTLDLAPDWALTLGGSLGWMTSGMAGFNYGVSKDAASDWQASANLGWSASDSLGLNLLVLHSSVLDGDLRDAVDEPDNAGVSIGATFSF